MSAHYWNAILGGHALAESHRTVAANTCSGWADDRMMQAYDLIWAVMRDHAPADVHREFRALLRLVEAADELMIDGEMA